MFKKSNFFLLFLQSCIILWIIGELQFESVDFSLAIQIWMIGAFVAWFLPKEFRWLILIATTFIGIYFIKQFNILPILGSIFTLRAVLYAIELKKNPSLWGWRETVSYFLMLPNFTLLIFPLISYESFCNGLRSEPKFETYTKGLFFISSGALQFVLYKLISYYFYFPFEKVHSVGELSQFLVFNFLLYIRISGSFHMIVGALCLYGIDLPRINNFYLFSTSFIDFWRRINIYFRDFVIKFIFHPCYFYFKKLGHRRSFFLSIILVLFGSWFLHGLIYLFAFGKFRFTPGESIFWLIWGFAIFISSYYEEKRKPKKIISAGKKTIKDFYLLFLKITVFSFVLTFLWSISTSDDIGRFFTKFLFLEWRGPADLSFVLLFPLIGFLGALYRYYIEENRAVANKHNGLIILLPMVAFMLMAPKELKSRLSSKVTGLNVSEEFTVRIQNRDYYSGLQMNRATDEGDPDRESLLNQKTLVYVQDFREKIWNKNVNSTLLDKKITTNSWGLIDTEHSLQKPNNTVRLAIFGSCVSMSWAIEQGLEWPKIAEKYLNQSGKNTYEFINFSAPAYSLPIYPFIAELEASRFNPDYLIIEVAAGSLSQSGYVVSRALKKNLTIPYPEIYDVLGVHNPNSFIAKNYPEELSPETSEKLAILSFKKLSEIAKKITAKVVIVLMPKQLKEPGIIKDENHTHLIQEAKKNNFIIIDLTNDFDNKNIKNLIIESDNMTPEGHALLGKEFAIKFTDNENPK